MRVSSLIFSDRLHYLMERDGYRNGAELARAFFEKGIIEYNVSPRQTNREQEYNLKDQINTHLRYRDFGKISTLWIRRYGLMFGCSHDYLMGLIDHPTHQLQKISDATGITDEAITQLQEWKKENPDWGKHLSDMITDPEFMEVLQHYDSLKATAKYAKTITKEERNYIENMKRIDPDYNYSKDKEQVDFFKAEEARVNDAENATLYHIGRISTNIAKNVVNEKMIMED